jgi:Zn-dependent alcohol dehydrogenase
MEQKKMKLDGLFTHSFDLANINEAIQALRLGEAGRVLICCAKK